MRNADEAPVDAGAKAAHAVSSQQALPGVLVGRVRQVRQVEGLVRASKRFPLPPVGGSQRQHFDPRHGPAAAQCAEARHAWHPPLVRAFTQASYSGRL